MLRKLAVALLAASVFTAPVFAQGGSAANPPSKVVTAHSHLKTAKVKTSKRHARHHVKHVRHYAHVKRVKHVKAAHAVHGVKGDKLVRRDVSKPITGTNGAVTAPKAKSNVN